MGRSGGSGHLLVATNKRARHDYQVLQRLREGGLTLVPLSLYFENGWAKVELGLAKGRRSFDKRQVIAEREANREIAREFSRRLKGRPRQQG